MEGKNSMKKLCVLGLILALLLIAVPVVADDSTATGNPIQLAGFGTLSAFNQTVADFGANVTSGAAPLTVGFTDLSVNATGWVWYFGDESYTNAWEQMNAADGFIGAFHNGAVAVPDGSIVYCPARNPRNETYRSTDNGATWQLVNGSGGWEERVETYNSMVVLSNGTIVKMGGSNSTEPGAVFYNDTWISTDIGSTWQLVNASSGWTARSNTAAVALSDDSIVLTGGNFGVNNTDLLNDVWRSTDKGETWTQINASAGWSPRRVHAVVALSDDSIVLMGGYADGNRNDTWLSTDKGYTWTQVNASSGWAARRAPNAAAMPDDSIVLLGGLTGTSTFLGDVWRSTDKGSTWTEVNSSAFSPRAGSGVAVTSDGSLVVMDGLYTNTTMSPNDVWRLSAEGSTLQNPSHTYTAPGTYQVTLQVFNTDGYNSTRRTGYIIVTPTLAPVANFTGTPVIGVAPLTVTFTDLSTNGPTVWNWSFGDGSGENATVQNPVHTYLTPGVYDIALNASNSAGFDTYTSLGYINVTSATLPPVANFTGTPVTGVAPLTVTFTDLSTNVPNAWNWTFGDGSAENATVQNPVHTYATPGLYDIALNASNSAGFDTYTSLGYINVTTAALPPVANFTGTPTTGFAPLTVTFTDVSTNVPNAWNWTFGDGSAENATMQNPVHRYATGGLYTVMLNVTNAGGSNVSTQIGYINVTNRSSRIAVFNSVDGGWSLDYNGNDLWDGAPQDKLASFGAAGDIPVKGDWNSNLLDEIGLFRSPGVWILDANGNYMWDGPVTDRMVGFGATGDQPVVGDWTRDGVTKIGLFRSPGVWIFDYNGNNAWDGTPTDQIIGFGAVGDIPVVGDWNADGLDEIGLYRDGIWILDYNANNAWDGMTVDKILAYSPNGGTVPESGNWN